MSQSQKKKKMSSVLTYTFIVVRSVFSSSVLEKKGQEAFVWDKVPGFFMQVSHWLVKTLHKLDSQHFPSTLLG